MRMYSELAPWWPLLSSPADYAEEAAVYARELLAASSSPPRTLLELGSGGGNNASHMKRSFAECVLTDVSPEMLAVSRALNPECEHVAGDMRTLRLGREFDCVFVHDAIVYMTTEADLRAAIATAYVHCRAGGVALFAPDHLRETFAVSTDCGGHDGDDGRALRYLEWTWDGDPADDCYSVEYVIAVRERDGSVRVVHERHREGLFSRERWLDLLRDAGFDPKVVAFEHSEVDGALEVFVARKR